MTGNTIVTSISATGVFKTRLGMVQADNLETLESDATLHIRPDESFVATVDQNMVGHGIDFEGITYRITGQTNGVNYDTNALEHYRVTLKKENIAWDEPES